VPEMASNLGGFPIIGDMVIIPLMEYTFLTEGGDPAKF